MKALSAKIEIQMRDRNILFDLWRWKFLSLPALHALHFGDTSIARTYNRLRLMARAELISARSIDELSGCYWSLEKRGFELIQERLPELRENGFRSEWPAHDAICSAVQLGIVHSPEGQELSFVTEQEIRRFHPSVNPDWVPATQLHRPDGYLRFGIGSAEKVCALEIELNLKSNDRYQGIAHFYGGRDDVFRVLWFVPSESAANKLNLALTGDEPQRNRTHNVVLLSEFQKDGIAATISVGPEKGQALSTFFGPLVTSYKSVTGPLPVMASVFFHGQKSFKSRIAT